MSIYVRQLQLGPMQNFVYLLGPADSVETAVIDPAWDVPAILQAVQSDERRLTHVFVTHRHFDHTNGIEALLKHVTVPIVIHPDEIPHVGGDFPPTAFEPVVDDDVVEVGALPIRCIHTPGHTPGSTCFYVGGAEEALFTGDTLFVQHCGRCDFAGGDPRQMFDSLQRVLGKFPDRTKVYPGHDYGDVPVSSLGRERAQNPYLQLGSEEAFVAFRMRPRA